MVTMPFASAPPSQSSGVDVAHGEGHDDAQDAHGHVMGGEPHIGGVGRLEHAYDIQQRGDDGEDGAGEDDHHGRHHATADGGQGLTRPWSLPPHFCSFIITGGLATGCQVWTVVFRNFSSIETGI